MSLPAFRCSKEDDCTHENGLHEQGIAQLGVAVMAAEIVVKEKVKFGVFTARE